MPNVVSQLSLSLTVQSWDVKKYYNSPKWGVFKGMMKKPPFGGVLGARKKSVQTFFNIGLHA